MPSLIPTRQHGFGETSTSPLSQRNALNPIESLSHTFQSFFTRPSGPAVTRGSLNQPVSPSNKSQSLLRLDEFFDTSPARNLQSRNDLNDQPSSQSVPDIPSASDLSPLQGPSNYY